MRRVHWVALVVLMLVLVALGVAYCGNEETHIEDTIEGTYDDWILTYENITDGDPIADSIYLYLKDIKQESPVSALNDTSFFGIDEENVLSERVVDMLMTFDTFSGWHHVSEFMKIEEHISFIKEANNFYLGSRVKISDQIEGILIMSKDKLWVWKKGRLLVFKDGKMKSIVEIFNECHSPVGDGPRTKITIDSQKVFHFWHCTSSSDVVHENPEDYFSVRIVDFHYDESGCVVVHKQAQ